MINLSDFYNDAIYDAAISAGLLYEVTFNGVVVMCEFRAPDESLLDGLVLSTDFNIRYLKNRMPSLKTGDVVSIKGDDYQVREVLSLGDGSECRATLSKI